VSCCHRTCFIRHSLRPANVLHVHRTVRGTTHWCIPDHHHYNHICTWKVPISNRWHAETNSILPSAGAPRTLDGASGSNARDTVSLGRYDTADMLWRSGTTNSHLCRPAPRIARDFPRPSLGSPGFCVSSPDSLAGNLESRDDSAQPVCLGGAGRYKY